MFRSIFKTLPCTTRKFRGRRHYFLIHPRTTVRNVKIDLHWISQNTTVGNWYKSDYTRTELLPGQRHLARVVKGLVWEGSRDQFRGGGGGTTHFYGVSLKWVRPKREDSEKVLMRLSTTKLAVQLVRNIATRMTLCYNYLSRWKQVVCSPTVGLKVPDMILNITLPKFCQTHSDFGTKSLVICFRFCSNKNW